MSLPVSRMLIFPEKHLPSENKIISTLDVAALGTKQK